MLRQRCGSKSPQWGEVKEKTRYFAAACKKFEKRAAVEDCVEKFFLDEKTFLFARWIFHRGLRKIFKTIVK